MDQRDIWEKIAPEWQKFRTTPRSEVVEFLRNKKGLVLDLACANGRNFVKTEGTLIGIDFSQKMLSYAKKKAAELEMEIPLVRGDAIDLPFKDDVFDTVLLISILPSIKFNKHKQALAEVKRVTKNGGTILASVWNKDQPRFKNAKRESMVPWKAEGNEYERYYYLYTKDEFEALLKKFFSNVHVFDSEDRAEGKYPKNLIATARVRK